MRAQRVKLKSCKDDIIGAQGERSDALGYGPKMISSFFRSGLTRLWHVNPERKKEVGWGGSSPRAAASAALPLGFEVLHPGGMDENSPAFQRWDRSQTS